MVLFLYSDKNCEHQAIACIKSLSHKITDDVKIVYYTIGFDSNFKFKNLYKIRILPKPEYPRYHFYKSELSLLTMDLFPDDYYAFTDTDVLFSRKFSFEKIKNNESYPLASFGPHEYPLIWQDTPNGRVIFNETKLMQYFNVPSRTQRYVWSCFYTFNCKCRDFFEEYTSICKNQYLQRNAQEYFPYADETAFNICLWKRNATNNLGFAFVNTHLLSTVTFVETNSLSDYNINNVLDSWGNNWEYVENSNNVLLYHGFKQEKEMNETLNFLLN